MSGLLSQLRSSMELESGSDLRRGALIGAGVSLPVALAGIAYGEITNTPAAARPFTLFALVLAAWLGGRMGGVVATAVAFVVFLAYSTAGDFGDLSEADAWFFIAFAISAALINLVTAERERIEERLRESTEALAEAARIRQELLESVQASEARYEVLANAMPQLVWTATSDGVVDYYNARAADYEGVQRLPDGRWTWQPMVHADDMERTMAAWTDATSRVAPYSAEHRLRMKDGTYRWHVSRATPVRQDDGNIRWYGTATDVEALQRALAAKDEFLALVSHDLRSPLTTIMGYAALLRRGVLQNDEDKQTAVTDIESRARQLNETIEELIELARVPEGTRLDLEPVHLEPVVREVVEEVQEAMPCEVRVNCPDASLLAMGNRAYTRRVLRNLLSNAVKYGLDSPIEVDVVERPDSVELRVSDRGIGIGDTKLEQLFSPFYRADDASATQSHGLGIGLTLCKRLVEAQHGRIGAITREGGGSTFWFTLQRRTLEM